MKDIRLNMRLHFTFRKFSTHDFDKPWVLTANNQLNSGCIAYKLCTLCFILPFNDINTSKRSTLFFLNLPIIAPSIRKSGRRVLKIINLYGLYLKCMIFVF